LRLRFPVRWQPSVSTPLALPPAPRTEGDRPSRSLELPDGGVGIAHQARAAGDRRNLTIGAQADIVILQEQQVVAELVNQRARPVLAQVAATIAEAVPDRADAELARTIVPGL
jgi:hypothetical protein